MQSTEQRECRSCLTTKTDLNSGFDLNSSNEFQGILLKLTGVDVFQNKNISSWICDQCQKKIIDFDLFRTKFCESNEILIKKDETKSSLDEKSEDLEVMELIEDPPKNVDPKEEESVLEIIEQLEVKEESVLEIINSIEQLEVKEEPATALKRIIEVRLNEKETTEVNPVKIEDRPKNDAPKEEEEKSVLEVKIEKAVVVKVPKKRDLSMNIPSFETFQKRFVCLHCTNNFELLSSLMDHLKNKHPEMVKKTQFLQFECTICYKVLLHHIALEAHTASSHVKHCCLKCNQFVRDNETRLHKQKCSKKEMKMKSVKEDTSNCRTCLATTNEANDFTDIIQSKFYPEIFICCTGIDIKKTPGITTWMCGACVTKMNGFYNFQRKCWESDLVLRKKIIK